MSTTKIIKFNVTEIKIVDSVSNTPLVKNTNKTSFKFSVCLAHLGPAGYQESYTIGLVKVAGYY